MAFMMPLVKQNYSLYSKPGAAQSLGASPGVSVGTTAPSSSNRRVRKNSDQTDRRTTAGAGVNTVVLRRNAKSEGASLSSSPAYSDMNHQGSGGGPLISSKPMEIRRGRFSIPNFMSPQSSVRRSGSTKQRQPSSMPIGTKSPPPVKPTFSPSSRSSISSTSSSDSNKGNGNFHSRLLRRLRKTLGLGHKESRPTSS